MLYLPSIPLLRIHPSIVLLTLSFYLITLFCYGHLGTYPVIFLKLLLEFLHSMVVLYIKIFCICIFSFIKLF